MESAAKSGKSVSGIGGWLLLPAFALIIQPVMVFKLGIVDPLQMKARGFTVHYIWPAVIVDLAIVLLVLIVSNFFFKRFEIAPPLFIIYIMLVFVMSMVVEAFVSVPEIPFIAYIFGLLFFPAYFLFSRRVKATFVRSLGSENGAERLLRPMEPALLRFHSFLERRRRWIFVFAILFIAAVVILQCMLRAWRIDGNILKFLNYL